MFFVISLQDAYSIIYYHHFIWQEQSICFDMMRLYIWSCCLTSLIFTMTLFILFQSIFSTTWESVCYSYYRLAGEKNPGSTVQELELRCIIGSDHHSGHVPRCGALGCWMLWGVSRFETIDVLPKLWLCDGCVMLCCFSLAHTNPNQLTSHLTSPDC